MAIRSAIPDRRLAGLGAVWLAGLLLSGRTPADRPTWWMEIAPVLIVYPLLIVAALRGRRLTTMALLLIALHGIVLMVGGCYTYAEVPAGFWVRDAFDLARNPYDRLGHFMQGFVPAIVLRELLKTSRIRLGAILPLTVLAYCLAFSALYELIEFGAAVALGQGAEAFLGTQGDPWDTQWDMLTCLIGASLALALLSGVQDRLLARSVHSR